jgi:uncharacterized membrane protein
MKHTAFCFLLLTLIALSGCKKEKANSLADGVYFPKVKTIIQDNCLSCHSSTGTWQGRPTQFDTDTDIVAAAASIKAAVADSVTFINKRMPQGGSLSASDIDIIVQWFSKGGKATD